MKIQQPSAQTAKIKESLFFSGILAIIIVVLWIGVSVYGAYSNQKQDPDIDNLLTPLNPTLDLEALNQYRDSRITPPQQFEIQVVTKEGQENSSYTLNPFTNTTTKPVSPSTTPLPETSTEETADQAPVTE